MIDMARTTTTSGATARRATRSRAEQLDLVDGIDELAAAIRTLQTTDEVGVPSNQVEALAFAWLARAAIAGHPGNLPEVTGARGLRVLGAIYPR